ncbi:hypothetical protein [Microlunatus sp. GCM10028923]|uniref:hypothetical protein n=1 Tax=Microlunatus sp. GCM10028923 TaxID=3273400 RepID=UPI003606BDB7
MKLPLEMGRAGLGMIMFVFVMAAMILYFGRPAPGTGPFVITMIMLVGAAVLCTLLMIILRRSSRSDDRSSPEHPEKRKHHD